MNTSVSMDGATALIRVLLIDDHKSVLWGLEKLIESQWPRMDVVGKATSSTPALELAESLQPDVVVLDLDLGAESGLDVIPQLLERVVGARILVLTGMRDVEIHDRAILAGARGVIRKEESAEAILKAIEKVHEGELWLDRSTSSRIVQRLSNKDSSHDPEAEKIATLTARERQIVTAVVGDPAAPAKTISQRLNISEHTLRNHLTAIYEKLNVGTRLELFAYANQHGLK